MKPDEVAAALRELIRWDEPRDGRHLETLLRLERQLQEGGLLRRLFGSPRTPELSPKVLVREILLLRAYAVDEFIRTEAASDKVASALLEAFCRTFDVSMDPVHPVSRAEMTTAIRVYRAFDSEENDGPTLAEVFAERCGNRLDSGVGDWGNMDYVWVWNEILQPNVSLIRDAVL